MSKDKSSHQSELMELMEQLATKKAQLTYARTLFGASRPKGDDLYFIAASDIVKIGRAKDPERRLKELQTGCPYPLSLVATFAGKGSMEAEIHRRLSSHRCRGEWFIWTKDVDDVIKELKADG